MTQSRKYISFLSGLTLILVFAFAIVPVINHFIIPVETGLIKERGIDTGALIYSESEEAVEGNYFLLLSD